MNMNNGGPWRVELACVGESLTWHSRKAVGEV